MPVTQPVAAPKPTAVLSDRREGLSLIAPLQAAMAGLRTVKTEEDYQLADALFGRVKAARKTWALKMYGTKERPGPIPSIRSGLDQLYALNREVDGPLAGIETAIEKLMKAFKLEEFRQLRAIEDERLAREQATKDRIEELAAKLDAAKTPAAKARVEEQLESAESELIDAQTETVSEAVQGAHSDTRPKKIPTIKSVPAFIKGIGDGMIPYDCITVNMVRVRAYYKEDPAAVEMFPGVEIVDDIQIVGR